MPASSSRAARVLDRLADEQPRRTLYRREEPPAGERSDREHPGAQLPTPHRGGPGVLHRTSRRVKSSARSLGAVAAALCVAVAGVALILDRRQPPVEEQLPLAVEQPPADSSNVTGEPAAAAARTSPDTGEATVVVHVAGAVAEPGVVELPQGSRVIDAVRAAGGLRADADPDRVNLAAPVEDAQHIAVPAVGQELPAVVNPSAPPGTGRGASGSPAPIDLNTADAAALESLPGIGPATAAAILAHREREGPFRSVDALLDVRGIGEAKLEALRDLVTAGSN